MPTTPDPGSARPAATINQDIRALWTRAGNTLGPADRDEYHRLLIEWASAVRDDVAEAA
ncbi:hypothetical protein [Streptomyces sp. NPDC102264]|uniref:hypothetical protein n=1 Tax=Streptomyces sp. NPDC102264 TaxID=3366149 RepID=UPI003805FF5C